MPPRLPSAWTVAAAAAAVGCLIGIGSASLQAVGRPMRIGDFSGTIPPTARAEGGAVPKAVVSETEHHFGLMGTLQAGSHRFVVVNGGDATLELRKGQSSCGCTIADLEKTSIPPGESARVTLEWRTKGEGGPFRQQVTVHTNDPRRPDISMRISGDVVPSWQAIPQAIVFPKLDTHGGDRASMTLLTYGKPPPPIIRVAIADSSAADRFELDVKTLSADELAAVGEGFATGGHSIAVTTRPGLPIGVLRQTLAIELGGAGQGGGEATLVEIPIEGTVTGDITIAGRAWDSAMPAVVLGSVSSRSGLRTDLFLTVKGPHRGEVRPTVLEVVPPSLSVEIGESKPVGSGTVRRIPVAIAIPPGSPTCHHLGNQQGGLGRIVLETGHPEMPRLEIPVRVVVGP